MTRVGPASDGDGGFSAPGGDVDRDAWRLLFVVVGIILVGMAAIAAVAMGYGFPAP